MDDQRQIPLFQIFDPTNGGPCLAGCHPLFFSLAQAFMIIEVMDHIKGFLFQDFPIGSYNYRINQVPFSPIDTDDIGLWMLCQEIIDLGIKGSWFARALVVQGNGNMEEEFVFRKPSVLGNIMGSLFNGH